MKPVNFFVGVKLIGAWLQVHGYRCMRHPSNLIHQIFEDFASFKILHYMVYSKLYVFTQSMQS